MRNRYLASFLVLITGCQSNEAPPTEPPSTAPQAPLYADPPQDLGSSVSPEALAFSTTAGVFRGRYHTHEVAVTDGIIDVTPSHLDDLSGSRTTGGTLGLQTTRVAFGESEVGIGTGIAQQIAPNVVEVPRGELVEQITNREDGIEQSWKFETQPLAGGDLTVEVAVSGHSFVMANESGLHFQSDRGLGFRYSHAIWRDAAGNAWHIESRFEDDQIKITVPEDVITASIYPAVLDPTVSGELFTDTPVNGTPGTNSFAQDIASSGTQYFAAWTDQRDGSNDIFGTRINANGAVADAIGIRINQATGTQQNPTVAFVGNGYVVAWEDVIATGNSNITAAFVTTEGVVTQLGTVAGTGANETQPSLGSQGGEALLVWQSGTDLVGARFAGGAFGAPFSVAAGANIEKEPAVSGAVGHDYLVAYTESIGTNDNVRGQRVSLTGALSGAAFDIAVGATGESTPAIAFDGTNHLVIISIVHSGTSNDIGAVRVNPTGTLVDAAPVDITRTAGAQLFPDVACNGASCFVLWEDTRTYGATLRNVFGAQITAEPAVTVVTNDIPVSAEIRQQTGPAIAIAGTQYLTTFNDTRDLDTTSVRAARVDAAGTVIDATGVTIVTSISNFQEPAIAQTTSLTDYLWSAGQANDVNLVHVRFNGDGVQRDPAPRVVSSAAGAQLHPAATGIGTNAFTVWQDSRGVDRDIYAGRINMGNGNALDGNGIQITNGNGEQVVPKVASTNTSSLIVWQDRRTGTFDILGAVVDNNGVVLANDIPICTSAGDQTRPNVAWSAADQVYLVVWNDPNGNGLDIRGARVNAAGAVLDGACGAVISGAAGAQFGADVVFGSGRFFVAWEDRRNSANQGDIFGARVNVAGGSIQVLDPNGIAVAQVAGSNQNEVAVAFAGYATGAYIAVWTDDRTLATTSTDIRGAQIAINGAVSAQFVVSATPEAERTADVSQGTTAAKPLSVAYVKVNSTIRSARVQLRRLTVGTVTGQACTQDSQCESGFCRDFKCCDSDCGGGGSNGNVGDCQACSLAHHGQADGTCTTIVNTTYTCRTYVNPRCDLSERCNGVDITCPPDLGQRQGLVCNEQGAICPANDVTGSPHVCAL